MHATVFFAGALGPACRLQRRWAMSLHVRLLRISRTAPVPHCGLTTVNAGRWGIGPGLAVYFCGLYRRENLQTGIIPVEQPFKIRNHWQLETFLDRL